MSLPDDAFLYVDDDGYEFWVTPARPEPPPTDHTLCGGCMGCHMCPYCSRLEGEGHAPQCSDA